MLGHHTPLFGLYYSLPFGSLFRIPIRMAFAYSFLACLLASLGVEGVAEGLAKRRLPALVPRAAAALLALLIGVDGYTRVELTLAHPVLPEARQPVPTQLLAYLRTRPHRQRMFIGDRAHMKADLELPYKFGTQHQVFVVPDYEPLLPIAYLRFFPTVSDALFHGHVSVLAGGGLAGAGAGAALDLMSVQLLLPRLNQAGTCDRSATSCEGTEASVDGAWIERASARLAPTACSASSRRRAPKQPSRASRGTHSTLISRPSWRSRAPTVWVSRRSNRLLRGTQVGPSGRIASESPRTQPIGSRSRLRATATACSCSRISITPAGRPRWMAWSSRSIA
jgi:hypothetical protein